MESVPRPRFDRIVQRLVDEARREFPRWRFARRGRGWQASSGDVCVTGESLAELRQLLREYRTLVIAFPGWSVWRGWSSLGYPGEWWATCSREYAAEHRCARTVSGNDLKALQRAMTAEVNREAASTATPDRRRP